MLTNAYCEHCEESTAFEVTRPDVLLNLLLAVVTLGIWCIAWVPKMFLGARLNCLTCGTAANGTPQKVIRGLSYTALGLTAILWVVTIARGRPAVANRVNANQGPAAAHPSSKPASGTDPKRIIYYRKTETTTTILPRPASPPAAKKTVKRTPKPIKRAPVPRRRK